MNNQQSKIQVERNQEATRITKLLLKRHDRDINQELRKLTNPLINKIDQPRLNGDCKKCVHYKTCKLPCIYVDTLANGNTQCKERIMDTDVIERTDQRNYNDVLGEMIEDQRNIDANRIEYIRTLSDHRIRIIAAAALADIPQRITAKLINHSQGRISQLYQSINAIKINHR